MTLHGKTYHDDFDQHITTYGKASGKDSLGAAGCLSKGNWDGGRPPTPDNLKLYRTSYNAPGKSRPHRGIYKDGTKNGTFGIKTAKSDKASELINPPLKSGITNYLQDTKERIYHSRKQLPLGKTFRDGKELPSKTKDPNYAFGIKTDFSESAKVLIYPTDIQNDEEEDHPELYLKSHGSIAPGAQTNRKYNWPQHIDDNFKFGIKVTSNYNVKDCIKPSQHDADNGFNQKPKIVSLIQQRHNDLTKNRLGKTKPNELVHLPPDHVFGKKGPEVDEGGAAAAFKMDHLNKKPTKTLDRDGNWVEIKPKVNDYEKTIGKTLRPGFRNQTKPGDENRVFGVPTIRHDLPKKVTKSITDNQNYGDDTTAIASIYPSVWATIGVYQDDFDCLLSKKELYDLYVMTGVVDEDDFDNLFEEATSRFADEIQMISERDRVNAENACTIQLIFRLLTEKIEATL